MNHKLTIQDIQLYNHYNGNWKNFCQASSYELTLIDEALWNFISLKHREIIKIAIRSTAYSTNKYILSELQNHTEQSAFEYFVNKIPFFKDFQKIKQILLSIQSFITPETDTLCTKYEDANELIHELAKDIEKIEYCDFKTLDKIKLEFAPTSTLQEIAMTNGWIDEYLKLSEKFDFILQNNHYLHNRHH